MEPTLERRTAASDRVTGYHFPPLVLLAGFPGEGKVAPCVSECVSITCCLPSDQWSVFPTRLPTDAPLDPQYTARYAAETLSYGPAPPSVGSPTLAAASSAKS